MKYLIALSAALLLAGCVSDDGAPNANEAALLILKTKAYHRAEGAPVDSIGMALILGAYDPSSAQATVFPQKEITLSTPNGFTSDEMLTAQVKPGRYVISRFMEDGYWGECFNLSTVAFDIKAGEALYLGELNLGFHSRHLTEAVAQSGDRSLPYSELSPVYFVAYDTPDAPHLAPATSSDALAPVQDYVSKWLTQFAQPVRQATYYPAHIAQETSSGGRIRYRCGAASGDSWSWQSRKLDRVTSVLMSRYATTVPRIYWRGF